MDDERSKIDCEALQEVMGGFFSFLDRGTEDCPRCGEHVTTCEQVGRGIYARPCGCRVAQGRVHENWLKE